MKFEKKQTPKNKTDITDIDIAYPLSSPKKQESP